MDTPKTNGFSTASLICGILAILFSMTLIFSVVFGALAVLFAVLSRNERRFSPASLVGIWFAGVAFAFSIYVGILVVQEMPKLMNDPLFIEYINSLMQ